MNQSQGGEFGSGFVGAGGEQSHDQVAVPAGEAEERFETQAAAHGGDGIEVSVGQGAQDLHPGGRVHHGFALQRGLKILDGGLGR
ncbi:MAG: hypothetical protein ABWX89_08325 [Paeniglutamicibacter terrestris]